MPKPLSKTLRDKITERASQLPSDERQAYEDLLAAEAYWRETVKDSAEYQQDDYLSCHFCGACRQKGWHSFAEHCQDCPWRIAQEEG
jgi:hypothetical protein